MISHVRIVTLPDYPHSHAFDEVAEAFASALNSDVVCHKPHANCGLIFGSHLLPYAKEGANKDDVLYQTEVVSPECAWFKPEYIRILREHEVWDYSPRNVEALKKLDIHAKLVPIRYMPCMSKFTNKPPEKQDIDVLFYGSMNERRKQIIDGLLAEGVEVYKAFNVYGKERDDLIARSKIVLNIHQYDHSAFEIFRCAHLMANRKCVVSEESKDEELDDLYEDCVAFCETDRIFDRCRDLLAANKYLQFEEFEHNILQNFSRVTLTDQLKYLGVLST